MSMTSPDRIELDPVQRQRLRHLIRAGTTAQQLVERARIVMLAAAEWTNTKTALTHRCVRQGPRQSRRVRL